MHRTVMQYNLEWQQQVGAAEETITALQAENVKLQEEATKLEVECQEAHRELQTGFETWKQEREGLETEANEKVQALLSDWKQDRDSMHNQAMQQVQTVLESWNVEKEKLKTETKGQVDNLLELWQQERDRLESELYNQASAASVAEESLKQEAVKIAAFEASTTETKKQLEGQVANLQNDNNVAKSQCTQLKRMVEGLQHQMTSAEREAQQAQLEALAYEDEVMAMRRDQSWMERATHAQQQALSARMVRYQGELKDMAIQSIADTSKEQDQLRHQVGMMSRELNAVQMAAERAESQASMAMSEKRVLEAHLHSVEKTKLSRSKEMEARHRAEMSATRDAAGSIVASLEKRMVATQKVARGLMTQMEKDEMSKVSPQLIGYGPSATPYSMGASVSKPKRVAPKTTPLGDMMKGAMSTYGISESSQPKRQKSPTRKGSPLRREMQELKKMQQSTPGGAASQVRATPAPTARKLSMSGTVDEMIDKSFKWADANIKDMRSGH
ncbi:hypothetical protein CYMTET_17864 [Cymbomonas tetramitiformis]|uniref:Uncharacterized protein n=1 Tax=Cymbomonas tetramitiformis TaxID=36881 RepID=A0AAE0G9E5_9CHLO|nr:hypothetical protein CYMTET_17864 [Cymbomonas tetramitiformis]